MINLILFRTILFTTFSRSEPTRFVMPDMA
jgi:hypothetical protein